VWKSRILIVGLILSLIIVEAQGIGSITLVAGTIVKTKYGQLTVAKNMVMASMAAYANGTILFNVTSFELVQRVYQFNLRAYGNGTWNIRFWGIIPIQVIASSANAISYNFPSEQISYTTSQTTPLIVIYGPYPIESQKVLFIDDFIYTNPLLESQWTIDRYTTNANTGISTSSGYLQIVAQSTNSLTGVHVTQPAIDPSTATADGAVEKRKLTVSLIPYTKNETSFTSNLQIGLGPLRSTGGFPGSYPYSTPVLEGAGCLSFGAAQDIGHEFFYIDNTGQVKSQTCGDPSGTPNIHTFNKIDPTRYTVITILTSAIACSNCQDHVQPGTAWVWFRIYQRDTNGNLVTATDQNFNVTSGVAPYYQTSYLYISQFNNNNAATGQLSKIDLVQLQNYGSPVCLSVPGGTLCTRLPPIPSGLGQGLISDIAWLANQIGFGDEQIGAIIMFMVLSTGFAFIPFILTRNYLVGGTGLLLVFTFFIYAGFIPTWMLFIPILFGGVLGVLLVNRLLGSHSLMGGGGSDNG
jgi:hypothetical protein